MSEKKTDYYTMRRNAMREIDQMLEDNRPAELIIYYISGKYGFGEKIVKERISQKQELDKKINESKAK